MSYDFRTLSPSDFEDLTQALLQKDLGVRLEAFGAGPDSGIDLRHARSGKTTIVQAKHFERSGYSALLSHLKKEAVKVRDLNPDRYILATSVSLTPARKKAILGEFGSCIKRPADIYGQEDLNNLLKSHPVIERTFYKLWVTSAAVLDRVIHNSTYVQSEDEADRIQRALKVYVRTPARAEAIEHLQKRRLLIITGAPGVGKSTLARILAWHLMCDDFELVSIGSFEEALNVISKQKKQVFFFDDFMGQIRLTPERIDKTDENLLKFIDRVQRYPHTLFVLTSREYILRQAQYQSSKLSDSKVDLRTFTIGIDEYDESARARIVYNHIYFSELPEKHKFKLLTEGFYLSIIDHKNFSPRLIESLTSPDLVETVDIDDYRGWIKRNLDNPKLLWEKPFRAHLSAEGRHLLTAMFFKEDGSSVDELRAGFTRLHKDISSANNVPTDTMDWHRALKETEGTFIEVSNGMAQFPNPSLRVFLDRELRGSEDVIHALGTATQTKDIGRIVDHIVANTAHYRDLGANFCAAVIRAAKELARAPPNCRYGIPWAHDGKS